jgi:hypothetical protein
MKGVSNFRFVRLADSLLNLGKEINREPHSLQILGFESSQTVLVLHWFCVGSRCLSVD